MFKIQLSLCCVLVTKNDEWHSISGEVLKRLRSQIHEESQKASFWRLLSSEKEAEIKLCAMHCIFLEFGLNCLFRSYHTICPMQIENCTESPLPAVLPLCSSCQPDYIRRPDNLLQRHRVVFASWPRALGTTDATPCEYICLLQVFEREQFTLPIPIQKRRTAAARRRPPQAQAQSECQPLVLREPRLLPRGALSARRPPLPAAFVRPPARARARPTRLRFHAALRWYLLISPPAYCSSFSSYRVGCHIRIANVPTAHCQSTSQLESSFLKSSSIHHSSFIFHFRLRTVHYPAVKYEYV